jgi:hypothetical protein
MIIRLKDYFEHFAENKDVAKEIRENKIKKYIETASNPNIVLDFIEIDSSTQSFIHALISGLFQDYGEKALDYFEFKNCSKPIESLITTVINYSLE